MIRWYVEQNPSPTVREVCEYASERRISLMNARDELTQRTPARLQCIDVATGEWKDVPTHVEIRQP